MLSLIVEVEDTERSETNEYVFDRSPIRIGRSQLNDLPVPFAFVSHCHGVLHFDKAGCQYVDLGSTNGTYLGDDRLEGNVPAMVPPGGHLRIGPLRLTVRTAEEERKSKSRHSYAFAPVIEPPASSQGPSPRSEPSGPVATPDLKRLVREVGPLYQAYRSSWKQLASRLTEQLSALPLSTRQSLGGELLGQFPELAQEAEFRRLLGTDTGNHPVKATGSPKDSGLLESVLRAMLPANDPARRAEHAPAVAKKLGAATFRFAQAFLELRQGHEQFLSEMALQVSTELKDFPKDVRAPELLSYLLDPAAEGEERVDELSRAFGDLMLHQVAMVNAYTEGARAALEELEPSGLARQGSGVLGWLGRVFGADGRWSEFRRRYQDLQEEKTLSTRLFGRRYARAYASVFGRWRTDSEPVTRGAKGTSRV